jgi:hypothetical protein
MFSETTQKVNYLHFTWKNVELYVVERKAKK